MALQATPYRFRVQLSHVDRSIYEALDVRMARHPSETERHLLARLFAFCAYHEEHLEFSKGGLSSPDEPALAKRTLDGRAELAIEIGTPSEERLHKASKAWPRVVVVTHNDPKLLKLSSDRVHKLDQIEIVALTPQFLDEVATHVGDRGAELELTITEGTLYVTINGATITGALERVSTTS